MIDTNVIIDFLIAREPFYNSALQVIKKCASGEVNGYIAFHSLPNLWYILRKIPEETRREWLEKICKILNVTSATHEAVIKAIKMEKKTDIIVLAGKGQEPYQEINGVKHPFDERIIVNDIISKINKKGKN